ncbi:MAG TPA: hypothetical protein H9978_04480 [Candidatus Corynebacterium faecipullorum]|nr:hypothetical protein [Candidatus Corynebacterium faecipullorum]
MGHPIVKPVPSRFKRIHTIRIRKAAITGVTALTVAFGGTIAMVAAAVSSPVAFYSCAVYSGVIPE